MQLEPRGVVDADEHAHRREPDHTEQRYYGVAWRTKRTDRSPQHRCWRRAKTRRRRQEHPQRSSSSSSSSSERKQVRHGGRQRPSTNECKWTREQSPHGSADGCAGNICSVGLDVMSHVNLLRQVRQRNSR